MNENWPRWIKASFYDAFSSNYETFFEGDDVTEEQSLQDHIEIRLDVDYEEVSRDQYHALISVNILCVAGVDPENIFKLDAVVGVMLSKFARNVSVKEYGDGDNLLNCAIRQGEVITTNFAQKDNVQRTTLEGQYLLNLGV
jgi:hypothetical protein